MRFWIPHCGFQIPSAGFRILPVQIHIPKHKRFQILVSGLLIISTFRFLGMTSMANFVIEGHVV